MELDYPAVASRCLDRALILAARRHDNPRTVKNLAFAWRQLVFFLSHTDTDVFIRDARERVAGTRLEPALANLKGQTL